jgi:hypothetical protein
MKSLHAVGVLVLGLSLTGCATILGGREQTITVNANVSGADVYLNQTLLGETPLTAKVKRGQEGVLRVTAEGYQPYQAALNKKISSLFWVNILSGGAFGSTTDYTTGAMYEYEPDTYMVTLQAANPSTEQRSEWQLREGLRSFVLLNNQAIVSDLAVGQGEYVDVLVDILGVTPEDRAGAVDRWRTDYAASETALDFANKIVAELD